MGSQHAYDQTVMSYELYQEIADELSMPVDPRLSTQVRYDLYNSKLVFLRNLFEQCFRIVNSRGVSIADSELDSEQTFSSSDLNRIHEAVDITHAHIRETILESLQQTFMTISEETQNESTSA